MQAANALRQAAKHVTSDQSLMAASRALVPADYTTGNRFSHDPALPQPAWPVLQPIRALADTSQPDAIRFATVDALQARNRMQHALLTAISALGGN
jgi:hypothetical protein